MYNDYPTIYQSTINENLIYLIILGIIAIVLLIVIFISLSKIFKKANRSAISALIPFYNLWVLIELVDLPTWYFFLFFIPIVNIWVFYKSMQVLAKSFRRSNRFAIGLLLLPFIFFPILASKDSEYIGINISAMEGKSVAIDISQPVEEKQETINEEVDEASANINISIGGGVYQKDYTSNLLQVDKVQAISEETIQAAKQKQNLMNSLSFSKPTFIQPIEKEEKVEEPLPKQMSIEFPTQMPEMQKETPKVPPVSTPPLAPVSNSKPMPSEPQMINPSVPPIEPTPNVPSTNNSPVSSTNGEFKVCPKCGTKVKGNAKVCFLCGTSLS